MNTTTEQISLALRGKDSQVLIYWDSQDPCDSGPAYRSKLPDQQESGGLEFICWMHVSGRKCNRREIEGYNLGDYFKNKAYSGPDLSGIYPLLE